MTDYRGVDTKDGQWRATEPTSGSVTYTAGGWSGWRDSYTYRKHGYRARVFRWDGKRFEMNVCPHAHKRKDRAMQCARRAANWLNRKEA